MPGHTLNIDNKIWKRCSNQPFPTGVLYFRIEDDGRIVKKFIYIDEVLRLKKALTEDNKG